MNLVKMLMEAENITKEEADSLLWDALRAIQDADPMHDDIGEIFSDITGLDSEYVCLLL